MPLFIDDRDHPGASIFTFPDDGNVAALDEAIDAARNADVAPALIEHLDTFRHEMIEADGHRVVPGLWSMQRSGAAVESLQAAFERDGFPGTFRGRGLRPQGHWVVEHANGSVLLGPAGAGIPSLVLTDEDERLVVPIRAGDEEVSVNYQPDFRAHDRLNRPVMSYLNGFDEVWFEGFYMLGTGSVMGRVLQPLRVGFDRLKLQAAAAGGLLVGRVVHWRGYGPRYLGDAFQQGRLSDAKDEHPDLARIVSETAKPVDRAIVFVHGTLSSSFAITQGLGAQLKDENPGLCFRFEHDTLRPINANARALAEFIERLETEDVLVVAHSRGGLVSVTAANFLRDEAGWTPEVWTLGAPHQGTRWAAGGHAYRGVVAMAMSAKAGLSSAAKEIFRLGQVLGGNRYEGFVDMIPGSSYLQGMCRNTGLWSRVSTYAGDAASARGLRAGPPWLQTTVSAAAQSVLESPHDTVVEVAAASPDWHPQATVYDVDHFSYFQLPEVHQQIQDRL